MVGLMERLWKRESAVKQQRLRSLEDAKLRALDDEASIDADELHELLALNGMTPTDFANELDRLRARRQWKANRDAVASKKDAAEKALAEYEAASAKLDALIAVERPKVQALFDRHRLLVTGESVETIDGRIMELATDEQKARMIELKNEVRKRGERLQVIDIEIARLTEEIPAMESHIAGMKNCPERTDAERLLVLKRKDLADYHATSTPIRAEVAKLKAEADALAAEMLRVV